MKKVSKRNACISEVVSNHVGAMLAYWDDNLICRFANAAYYDWFGKTPDEMIGKMEMEELLGSELFTKNLPYISGALAGKVQTFEREIPDPSGIIRNALASYFPDISHGKVKGFFVHVADISSQKQLEKQLTQSHETITHQNDVLLNFANIISHNLRNYSHSFSFILEMLKKDTFEEIKEEMLPLLTTVSQNFEQTIKDLDKMVSVQNISQLKPERIFLNEYYRKVISELAIQINSNNVQIANETDPDCEVMGIPAYIESIFFNFLSNAIKYRSRYRDPVITLRSVKETNGLKLIFSDNGRGINLEKYGQALSK